MAETLAIECRSITKQFGDVIANSRVDLRVKRGSIHGIIGENGAGKSTTMKILYGLYPPDEGQIIVHGVPRKWSSSQDAIKAGLGMVHQHFMLAGPYTVLDNILLGAEPTADGCKFLPKPLRPISRKRARTELKAIALRYGFEVPLDEPVESLPVGVQQRVEILKLLYRSADILILDEPTAVLTPLEVTELFENLRKLKDEGKTIIIITHKLKEVIQFTDHITVFRAGRVTGELPTAGTTPQRLADLMVGRKVLLQVDVPPQSELGASVLNVSGLKTLGQSEGRLNDVSLCVRRNEIVGIAGVEGNGQSELLESILHPEVLSKGRVEIFGQDVTLWTTAHIRDLGVAFIPEDRQAQGLLMERSLEDNFLLGLHRLERFSKNGWINRKNLRAAAEQGLIKYDVRPPDLHWQAQGLSGGNQQKLIAAREFERSPQLLIAAQPTRGVDVGAIEFMHRRIVAARSEGAGVLLVSSELDEVLALSDRILVMFAGRIVAEFKRGQVTDKELGLYMGGGAA